MRLVGGRVAGPLHRETHYRTSAVLLQEGTPEASPQEFIAYYRVSTGKQGKSGLGIEAQRAAVASYLNGGDWLIVAEFTEVESGRRSDRPALEQALAAARAAPGLTGRQQS